MRGIANEFGRFRTRIIRFRGSLDPKGPQIFGDHVTRGSFWAGFGYETQWALLGSCVE